MTRTVVLWLPGTSGSICVDSLSIGNHWLWELTLPLVNHIQWQSLSILVIHARLLSQIDSFLLIFVFALDLVIVPIGHCVIDLQLAGALIRLHIWVFYLQRWWTFLAVEVSLVPVGAAHHRIIHMLIFASFIVPSLALVLFWLQLLLIILHLLVWLWTLGYNNALIDIAHIVQMLRLRWLSWLDTILLRWNPRQIKIDTGMIDL